MKSSAKVKSFHVAVRGNIPAARDFAVPDTYTTTRRRAVGNDIDIISRIITSIINQKDHGNHHRNDQSESPIINRPPTGHPDIESTTSPPTSDPTSAPKSAASETTVDREGDGRICEELESLGGR